MKTAREPQVRKAQRQLRRLAQLRPRDAAELFRFVDKVLDLRVTAAGPRDYLQHAFFEDSHDRPRDAVVWANRGGGKTMLGAAATLLDLLFKPGIQIRILGGSFEQSQKMYEHLVALLERPVLRDVITQLPTQRRVELESGSTVELLSQSHRSVRGTRVHKLRCDEVEEFDPDVWEAAQLVTRSGRCGLVEVRGAIEALSTMHRPGGLMQRLVDANHAQVFKWNAMDVAARCESWRQCDDCALWSTCGTTDVTVLRGPLCEFIAGEQNVYVKPTTDGYARDASRTVAKFSFIQDLRFSEIVDKPSSTEGGRYITVRGAGFSPVPAENRNTGGNLAG